MIVAVMYWLNDEQKKIKHLACNSIHNNLLAGFYMEDDKPELVDKYMPNYLKEIERLEKDGLWFDGKHYKIEFTGKADYKFLRLLAGLQDGEPTYGCSGCCCPSKHYDLTLEQHAAAGATDAPIGTGEGEVEEITDLTERDATLTGRLNHDPEDKEYTCPACGDAIGPDHVEDRDVKGGSFANKKERDAQCTGHFSVQRSWYYKMIPGWRLIMDLLHNKLRIVPQLYFWTVARPLNGQADRQAEVRLLSYLCTAIYMYI